ncbi:hypothetical protein [Roseimicrobium gellanilyticum]|nr:hypothetical protein [Roseimicrobium gellanilyticum]
MGSVLGNFLGSRDTMVDLLEALAPEGLPPLGAVVLVNAAAQTVWDGVVIHTELQHACDVWKSGEPLPATLASLWMHAARGLDAISKLPNDLKNGAAKRLLVRTIFEGAFNRLPADLSRDILDEFKSTPSLEPFMQRAPDINGQARLLRDLSALAKAFDRLPPGQLENRLRTGLDASLNDQMPLPLEEKAQDPPPIEVPDDLLLALEEEGGQLAQVAGVARRLSAILHVPKPVWQQDDLPVGGVSDITNRGEPDRLLLTELAWDELTFATRLAQGEALYTRRESPPGDPPPKRKILLDTGIHLWGKPRLFALGTALALQHLKGRAGPQEEQGVEVYTLVRDAFVPAPLRTIEDVRTQLTRLEPTPYPAEALTDFVQQENAVFAPGEEVFLVSHPDAMARLVREHAWQQLAASCLLHSIQVDRRGQLMMARHTVAGARTLAQVLVDLDALLQGASERRPSRDLIDEDARLPAFYSHLPWPLLYPVFSSGLPVFELPQAGHIGITPERCVCYWYVQAYGPAGRVLCPYAPEAHAERAMIVDGAEPGTVALAFGRFSTCDLLVCDVHGRKASYMCTGNFSPHLIAGASLQSDALVVYHTHGCDAFSTTTGFLLQSYRGPYPRQHWFDGVDFREDPRPVPLPEKLASSKLQGHSTGSRHTTLCEAGFGKEGGLYFRKQSGGVYRLDVTPDRSPCWRGTSNPDVELRPLERFKVSQWRGFTLAQAEFEDGRRIVYDPRGFLHVVDGKSGVELSVMVLKGTTTAWSSGTLERFGDGASGSLAALTSLSRLLLRALPARLHSQSASSVAASRQTGEPLHPSS